MHIVFWGFKLTTIAEFYKICSVVLCNPPHPPPFFFFKQLLSPGFSFSESGPLMHLSSSLDSLGRVWQVHVPNPRLNLMFGGRGVKLRKTPTCSSEGCNIHHEKERSCTYLLSQIICSFWIDRFSLFLPGTCQKQNYSVFLVNELILYKTMHTFKLVIYALSIFSKVM